MRRVAVVVMSTTSLAPSAGFAPGTCPFSCGDLTGDSAIDLTDHGQFASCMGQPPGSSQECLCSDMDGSGAIDLRDFALLAAVFEQVSDEMPPGCTGTVGSTADLTAFRPQHGGGYAPFARTPVSDVDEESADLGPGIRIHQPGDVDPAGEDDLIEVELVIDPAGAELALRRGVDALKVWTTHDKQAGTEITFTGDKTDLLPFGAGQTQMTLWIEWESTSYGIAELYVEPVSSAVVKDTLVFHTFHGIVAALGGENQTPADPADPNTGTFVVATELYRMGYDVHMFDEDNVSADGSGIAFDEVVNAIQNRGVDEVAIFGYSHGGGSTYDLADLLDISRPMIGVFDINFTSYVDAVSNNSDLDTAQELRRPPSSAYHLNHYQNGVFFQDFGLDGGPVPDSNPPPTGLDVETTAWGADATHFEVDDFFEVRDLMELTLVPRVTR